MTVRLFGTEIYVSPLFFLALSLMLFIDRSGLYMPALLAVLTHEAGHLAVMRRVGSPVKRVRLIPAAVLIESPPVAGRGEETAVVIAGAAANFLVGGALFGVYLLSRGGVLYYSAAQLAVGLYNLIPVRGLDGGRLLLILFRGRVCDPDRFLKAVSAAFALALILAAAVIFLSGGGFNPSLLVFGVYIFILNIIKV